MDVSQRTTAIAGIALIVLSILTVVSVGLMASAASDKDPFTRSEVAEFLQDTQDNSDALIAAGAVGIVNDGVFVVIVAVASFILFRDRSPFLAALAMIGFAMAATISLVNDASNILLTVIADDFVKGGPTGVAAGDPAALELGRYVGMITYAFTNLLFTPLGTAFIALGAIITSAPAGIVNPPKWIGWLAIIAGLASWLAWLVVVAGDAGFVFFPINLISTLIFGISLGVWLLRHSDLQPAPMKA